MKNVLPVSLTINYSGKVEARQKNVPESYFKSKRHILVWMDRFYPFDNLNLGYSLLVKSLFDILMDRIVYCCVLLGEQGALPDRISHQYSFLQFEA